MIITTRSKLYLPSFGSLARCSEETTIFQVFFDDDVGHGIKHKLDVLCVCGTGHVRVDLFDVSAQVQVQELQFDVVTSILKRIGAYARQITIIRRIERIATLYSTQLY